MHIEAAAPVTHSQHLVHFWLEKVLLATAVLVQCVKQLYKCMKLKPFDRENCKTEADFYGCLAPA